MTVFFIGLGRAKLWDEDEAEYTRCAREMMDRGDWVVPTFNHRPWLEKPALLYWLMIGAFQAFGPTEFAARFPSALLALGTALLTYQLGRRLFRPQVGLWAGLILATSLMFVVVARAATFDSALVFLTTLSLFAYVASMGSGFWRPHRIGRGENAVGGEIAAAGEIAAGGGNALDQAGTASRLARFRAVLPKSWWQFAAIYAPMGLAVMVKGPLGVLLPVAAMGMFVLIAGAPADGEMPAAIDSEPRATDRSKLTQRRGWRRRLGGRLKALAADFPAATWAMRPFTLAAVVLAIAAPWYILVEIRTAGEFAKVFFWQHNVQYILHSQQGHAGSTFYYYPLALTIGFFPWTIALALGLRAVVDRLRRPAEHDRASLLAITWCAVWFIVMSLVGTKLPHYIVPTYPLLAIIAGLWIADWIAAPRTDVGQRWIGRGMFVVGALGVAAMVGLPLALAHLAPGTPSFGWLGMILVAGAVIGWQLQRRGRAAATAASLVVTAGAIFIGVFAIAAPSLSRRQTSLQITDLIDRLGTRSTPIGLCRIYLPGFVYYSDRAEPIVPLKQPSDVRKLFDDNGDFLIVTDLTGLMGLRPELPPDAVVLEQREAVSQGGRAVHRRPPPRNELPSVRASAPLRRSSPARRRTRGSDRPCRARSGGIHPP